MTLDLRSLILGALLAGIAVLLRETFTRVGHQRGTLRRDVYELTNVFPLWLSRFHPEFERLHGEFPPQLAFDAPPFIEEQQIRMLIMDIQTHARWPLVRGVRQVRQESSRLLSILMAVRARAASGVYLTTEEHTSISLKIHALGDIVVGEYFRHDDLISIMALGHGHPPDDLTEHYVNQGFIKHPPL
jgi:hypothetical protein